MSEANSQIEPYYVIQDVDLWIDKQISDAAKYDNRELLDPSSCWSLHALARKIYARGVADGSDQERTRQMAQVQRDRAAARHAEGSES